MGPDRAVAQVRFGISAEHADMDADLIAVEETAVESEPSKRVRHGVAIKVTRRCVARGLFGREKIAGAVFRLRRHQCPERRAERRHPLGRARPSKKVARGARSSFNAAVRKLVDPMPAKRDPASRLSGCCDDGGEVGIGAGRPDCARESLLTGFREWRERRQPGPGEQVVGRERAGHGQLHHPRETRFTDCSRLWIEMAASPRIIGFPADMLIAEPLRKAGAREHGSADQRKMIGLAPIPKEQPHLPADALAGCHRLIES